MASGHKVPFKVSQPSASPISRSRAHRPASRHSPDVDRSKASCCLLSAGGHQLRALRKRLGRRQGRNQIGREGAYKLDSPAARAVAANDGLSLRFHTQRRIGSQFQRPRTRADTQRWPRTSGGYLLIERERAVALF